MESRSANGIMSRSEDQCMAWVAFRLNSARDLPLNDILDVTPTALTAKPPNLGMAGISANWPYGNDRWPEKQVPSG
jgi:hypothetical protein